MEADALIGIKRPGQQQLRNLDIDAKEAELRHVRERHFLARTPATKAKCREQDAKLRGEIADMLRHDGWNMETARHLADWDPATDPRLTAWEVVHQLIRALEAAKVRQLNWCETRRQGRGSARTGLPALHYLRT